MVATTAGYYRESIADGLIAIQNLGRENYFLVDATIDVSFFICERLRQYVAIIFLGTTMDVSNPDQQVAMECFIKAGCGHAVVHASADTEYDCKKRSCSQ
jgi:hypothetical protein